MSKTLVIIKREYLQRLRSRLFIIGTLLGPVIIIAFAIVPGLLFSMRTGGPMRIAIVDGTGKMYGLVRQEILREDTDENNPDNNGAQSGSAVTPSANVRGATQKLQGANAPPKVQYETEEVPWPEGQSLDEIKHALDERVLQKKLDAYIVIPRDVLTASNAEFYGRNVSDEQTIKELEDRLSDAVIEQRMSDAKIDRSRVRELSRGVHLSSTKVKETGEETDSGNGFIVAFVLGFFIYLTITMYGQTILGSVVEEKTTRVAEVLFSSVRAFPLMIGKLIGISLLALTQYAIWALAFALFVVYGAGALAARGINPSLPDIPPLLVLYFFLFFLLGYFVYATIYVLIGAMVTTTQEGGQIALPVIFLLLTGFYLAFPVIRNPNSSFAFWVSIVPFFSPITMLVRIVTETPPFWQIALSLLVGAGTSLLLIWIAARVYRIGMLMYGKRASIPEVWRWVRQS